MEKKTRIGVDIGSVTVGVAVLRVNTLIAGGENLSLVKLKEDGSSQSHDINTDCASGTGGFLDQPASWLGLSIKELSHRASDFDGSSPRIATRCAVFARTDLIHKQQKGHSPAAIATGICEGVALCLAEKIFKEGKTSGDLFMIGGVALNSRVVSGLEKTYEHLEPYIDYLQKEKAAER